MMVEGDEFHEMKVEEVISEDYTPEFDRNHMDIDEDLENEENEVLAEYNVLITQQLSNCLYQLQFPTRLHKFSNEFEPKVGRIKPTSKQLELEVPFTDNNEHYDRRKGFNFGSGLHNKPMKSATESLFQSQDENLPSLSSQTFVSELISNAANYMIGVINQDELHLTPLSGTLRLSPGFQYLDKIHEKEKSLNQRVNAQEEKENDPDKVIESKLIQVQMKKREESKEEAEKANQLKLRKQIEDESWSNLVLFNQNTDESIDLVDHLYGNSDSKVECISQPIDYLNEVGPKLTDSSAVTALLNSATKELKTLVKPGKTLFDIQLLPLDQLLVSLMLNTFVVPYTKIRDAVSTKYSDTDIIKELQNCANLVRGVWIIKSSLQYTGRAFKARQYLLSLFLQNEIVNRGEFNKSCLLLDDMSTNMLSEIAFLVKGVKRGWKLKWDPDLDFIERYPEVVANQTRIVLEFGKNCRDQMTGVAGKATLNVQKKEKLLPLSAGSSVLEQQKVTSTVLTSAPSGKTVHEQTKNYIRVLMKEKGVASFKYLENCIESRKKDSKLENNLLNVKPVADEFVKTVIGEACMEVQGSLVLKTLENAVVDEFRKPILQLFQKKKTLKKNEIVGHCENIVKKEFPKNLYREILKEFAVSKGPVWSLKEPS